MPILSTRHIMLLRMGKPLTMANGGDSDSDSSTNTTNQTTNNAMSVDKRNVASDAAVAISGNNNAIDRSTTSTTNFSDSSDRSTNFTDNSDRSVHYTSTDYGSVNASLGGLTSTATKALDVADGGVAKALDALKFIASENSKSVALAFDMSKAASANALSSSAQTIGLANNAISKVAESEDGGETTMVKYALMAVGAIGVAFALSKG